MLSKVRFFMTVALLCALSVSVSGQSMPKGTLFYVEIPTLQVDGYVELVNTLKADGHFEVQTACIPAHVLTIVVISPSDSTAFDQLAVLSGLSTVTHLENYNQELFELRCLDARRQ
jgi:hypothetical protein